MVNGAIGTILKIHETLLQVNSRQVKSVSKLTIEFDGKDYELEPVQSKFPVVHGVFITRKQFQICLAYAITIHKSQGLTVDFCVVDIGDSIFGDGHGQTYVAFSRVKSLSGLHILNLNPGRIKANNGSIVEYNRSRAIFRKDLQPLEIPGIKTSTFDSKLKQ